MWGKESQERQTQEGQRNILTKVCAEECNKETGKITESHPEKHRTHTLPSLTGHRGPLLDTAVFLPPHQLYVAPTPLPQSYVAPRTMILLHRARPVECTVLSNISACKQRDDKLVADYYVRLYDCMKPTASLLCQSSRNGLLTEITDTDITRIDNLRSHAMHAEKLCKYKEKCDCKQEKHKEKTAWRRTQTPWPAHQRASR